MFDMFEVHAQMGIQEIIVRFCKYSDPSPDCDL